MSTAPVTALETSDDLRDSVTEVEVNAATGTLTQAADYTDDVLHEEITRAVEDVKQRSESLGVAIYTKLLPLLAEAKSRYSQAGRRTNLDGQPTYYEYLESIGLNPATVRQWKHRAIERNLVEHIADAERDAEAQRWREQRPYELACEVACDRCGQGDGDCTCDCATEKENNEQIAPVPSSAKPRHAPTQPECDLAMLGRISAVSPLPLNTSDFGDGTFDYEVRQKNFRFLVDGNGIAEVRARFPEADVRRHSSMTGRFGSRLTSTVRRASEGLRQSLTKATELKEALETVKALPEELRVSAEDISGIDTPALTESIERLTAIIEALKQVTFEDVAIPSLKAAGV